MSSGAVSEKRCFSRVLPPDVVKAAHVRRFFGHAIFLRPDGEGPPLRGVLRLNNHMVNSEKIPGSVSCETR